MPTSVAAQRYLTLGLNRLGDTQKEQRRYDEAATAYQEALAVRHRLAEAEPDDPQPQIDLIAAHLNLWALSDDRDDKAEHGKEALRIYHALLARDPFDPRFNPLSPGHGYTQAIVLIFVFAGALTLPIGLIALARYRRVVVRWMKAAAEAGATDGPATTISRAYPVQGQSAIPLLSVEAAKRPERASRFRSAAIAGAVRAACRAAWVYTVAALAFASVSAVLIMQLQDIEIILASTHWDSGRSWPLLIGIGVVSSAWPVILTLALLWGPDRRRLGLLLIGYFGILLAFCSITPFSGMPPIDVGGVTLSPFSPSSLWRSPSSLGRSRRHRRCFCSCSSTDACGQSARSCWSS